MVPQIQFQSFPIMWPWEGATGTLALFSSALWTDRNQFIHLAGNSRSLSSLTDEPAQLVTIDVAARVGVVRTFFVEPTLASIDNSGVLITGALFDVDGIFRKALFRNWKFPTVPNPMQWGDFTFYNHTRHKRLGDHYYTSDVIDKKFAGISIITPQDLARLDTARGTAQLVVDAGAGYSQVVVPSVLVTANSLIQPWSMDDNVAGSLREVKAARTIGQDFTIRSNVVGDQGLVGWRISEPF